MTKHVLVHPLIAPIISVTVKGLLSSELSTTTIGPFVQFGRLSVDSCRGHGCVSCGSFFGQGVQRNTHRVSVRPKRFVDPYSYEIDICPMSRGTHLRVGRARCAVRRLLEGPSLKGECRNNCI